jgi:putative MATE family efflux protein
MTESVVGPGAPSLWAELKDAVRGTDTDFTEAPLRRAIILLAVPMVLEMVMESVFAVVNIFWVAKLGADATASVGLTESLLAIVYALAMGISIGVTAMVARRIGEKDPETAARTATQAIYLGVLIAVALGATGFILAPTLLRLMGASEAVVATGTGYARVLLGGEATVILLFLMNAAFRGAGDATIAMRVLWVANGFNLLLDPLLIFGLGPFPELGVTGAAVSTTVGRGIGVLLQLWVLFSGRGRLGVARRHLAPDFKLMGSLIRLSATGTFQMIVGMVSWIGLVRILATFGSAALAGYTVAIRIVIFALLPSWGLSNAAATMVGQGLGARKPDRAEQAVWIAANYNAAFLTVLGVAFFLAAEPMIRLFTPDPEVVRYATLCLRIVSLGFPLYAYGMVLTQSFNGAGDAWTPTWLNLFCFWLWELPLAWLLARTLGLGPAGGFIAITVSYATLAFASGVLFQRGKWKEREV